MENLRFEPLCPAVALSKAEILEDLLGCVSEVLNRADCDFNDSGAWSGYSARIKVELTLSDIDQTRIERTLKIGELKEPATNTVIEISGPNPETVRERIGEDAPSLEIGQRAQSRPRRWYAPRNHRIPD